jgi:hypothetical protein
MRITMGTLLLLATTAFAAGADLSGKWQIDRNASGNQSRQDCTFVQKANELTGTCSSDGGPVEMKGKVDGKSVTWTYKGDSAGGPVTVVYTGTLDADGKIAGTVTAVEFSVEGEFTATRSK